MERYFYLNSNNEQAGPVSPMDFGRYGINESTMIWKQGMSNWMRAGQIPELSQYFRPVAPTPPPPFGGTNYNGDPYNRRKPIKPDNGMVWAILSTLFCCLPFGIYSIIQASKVNGLYSNGCYDEAQRTAEEAKKWAGVGAIIGFVINVLYVLILIAAE